MRIKPLFALIAVAVAAGASCGKSDQGSPEDQAAAVTPAPQEPWMTFQDPSPGRIFSGNCARADALIMKRNDLRQMFTDSHPEIIELNELIDEALAACNGDPGDNRFSGEWQFEDGVHDCDGYLVRRADQDYCSDVVPDGWERHEYNGEEYFVQPLTDSEQARANY